MSKLCLQAERGKAEAQFRLGAVYYSGNFRFKFGRFLRKKLYVLKVEENPTEAVRWLQMAVKQKHDKAIRLLGMCYFDGIGVEINWKEAARLYEKVRGVYMNETLGEMYEKGGYGLERDLKRAYYEYSETDAGGFYIIQPHHVAEHKLDELYELIRQEDPDWKRPARPD